MLKTTMALVVVATFAGVAPVPAQGGAVRLAAATETPPSDRAAALRAQAEALYSQPRQWSRAASLLERAAEAAGPADASGYADLVAAGRLRATLGDYTAARADMEKAAAHALARGAVVDAAHAYIDAAYAAAADRQPHDARALVDSATLLAESPLLTEAQSEQILRRIRIS